MSFNKTKISGIYLIKNLINNNCYVGSSKNIHYRIYRHFMFLACNKHVNKYLQSAYNKYGKESFTYEILTQCAELALLDNEQFYIDTLKPTYNLNLIAAKPPSPLGKLKSKESIAKTAAALKGRKRPEWVRKRMRVKRLNHNMTNNHKYVAVEQLDKNTGVVIGTYASVVLAAKHLDIEKWFKIKSGISRCLIGDNATAYGYVWRRQN